MNFKVNNIKTVEIATDTYEVTLYINDDSFCFNAGQYVWVENNYGKRAFSISSSSKKQNEIKIIFRKGTSRYKKSLIEEKVVNLKVSEGRGFVRVPDNDYKTTYIVAGVGISPVVSILETVLDNKLKINVDLFNFNTSKEKQFYTEKLKLFEKSIKGLKLKNIIYDYKSGLDSIVGIDLKSKFVIIGNQNFVDTVYKILLSKKVDVENILFEENYPSVFKLDLAIGIDSVYKLAVDQSESHTIITDSNGTVIYANKAAERMTGYSFKEMEGQTPRLWGGIMKKEVYETMWNTIKNKRLPFTGELTNIKKDGSKYEVKATISPIIDKSGNLLGYVGSEDDITLDKKAKEEALKLSNLAIDREQKIISLKEKISKYE